MTGAEAELDALAGRLDRFAHAGRDGRALLQEVRLDTLERLDDDTFACLARLPELVVCCRPERQGGCFVGGEADRLVLLRRAARQGARYVDVEADVPEAALEGIEPRRRVLSWHEFEGLPADLEQRAMAMQQRGPAVVKLAVRIDDASQLRALQRLRPLIAGDAVLLGMGAAGALSRSHHRAFGSRWTYVACSPEQRTAPGQLSYDDAVRMGLPHSASQPLCALLGGEQVTRSPGPRIYTRLLRARGIDTCYVSLITARLDATLELLEPIGVYGLSVTMPLKQRAAELARGDAEAAEIGALNSLKRSAGPFEGHWIGCNTDVVGVREPLGRALAQIAAERVLILGAGGAARAAVVACHALGLRVAVSARTHAHAAAIADVEPVAWERRGSIQAEVLINATPVSGDASPWPEGVALDKRLVFELALGAPRSSLLEQAAREGALTLDPRAMWLSQGAAQMRYFFGGELSIDTLREYWP